MTLVGGAVAPDAPAGVLGRLRWGAVDGGVAALRLLAKLRHDPAGLVLTVAAPVVMVLIFGYVFGSAITVPGGGDYREYLVPGLLVSMAFNVIPAMVQMARDSDRGVVDRLRSMPVARAAVPFGQAAATAAYVVVSFGFMALCGLAVGWRVHRGARPRAGGARPPAASSSSLAMHLGRTSARARHRPRLETCRSSRSRLPSRCISNVLVPTRWMPRGCCDRRPQPGERDDLGRRCASCAATPPRRRTACGRWSTRWRARCCGPACCSRSSCRSPPCATRRTGGDHRHPACGAPSGGRSTPRRRRATMWRRCPSTPRPLLPSHGPWWSRSPRRHRSAMPRGSGALPRWRARSAARPAWRR